MAGFELSFAKQTLLVDPFLTRPPVYKLLIGRTRPDEMLLREHVTHADHILISHSHYDHLLDAPAIAGYTGAITYGSQHTCRIAAACGLPPEQIHRVEVGQQLALRSFRVEVVLGEHAPLMFYGPGKLPSELLYPLRLRDFVMDETYSFLIQVGEVSLLAWHNCRPSPARRADVLLLGPDILPKDLPELLEQVQPRLLIPVHWDNFFRRLNEPVRPFFRPPSWARPELDRYDPFEICRLAVKISPELEVKVPELLVDYDLSRETSHVTHSSEKRY